MKFNEINKFDIVIIQRVLINILNKKDQQKALNNIIRSLKKGGLLIAIEGFNSGLNNLNFLRKISELNEIKPAYHNLYLNNNFFKNSKLKIYDNSYKYILSKHYIIARVFDPLNLKANNKKFIYNSKFVRLFDEIFTKVNGNFTQLQFLSFLKV